MLYGGGTHVNPSGYISSMEQEGGARVKCKRVSVSKREEIEGECECGCNGE